MTNAVQIDYQGNLSGIDLDLDYDRVDADIQERLGCRTYKQIPLNAVTFLVVNANGNSRIDAVPVNDELTAIAAKYGHTEPIHGEGIVVGHDFEGDIAAIRSNELQEFLLTHTRPLAATANH